MYNKYLVLVIYLFILQLQFNNFRLHYIIVTSLYLNKICARRIVLDINANFPHNVIFLKIFAKGKTNSLLGKCILAFFSFQIFISPHNRHSHRTDAIHCLPTEILYGRGAPRHDRSLLATTLHQNIKRRTLKPRNGL